MKKVLLVSKLVYHCTVATECECIFGKAIEIQLTKLFMSLFLSSAVCKIFYDNPDVADYYEHVTVGGVAMCVTVCNSRHSRPKTCYNKGICKLYRDTGPLCE